MALPAELMQNVPTIEEFWAAYTKSREEWDRRMVKAEEEAIRYREEWDRGMEELRAVQRETARTVDRVGKQMGDLNNRFGELAEHLVAPGIIRRFN
ncbi:MAG: hypothetical protein LBR93_11105, partial [Treponema sp.]|nr:hypothetical protein [Treponema sp.]